MQQTISGRSLGVLAATAVRDVFNAQSARIRHDQGNPVWAGTAMHETVITTALIAGPGSDGPELYEVSLYRQGQSVVRQLRAPGVAIGPDLAQIDLGRAVQESSHEVTLDTAATVLTDAIGRASRQSPALVSPDYDLVILTRTGTSPIREQRHSGEVSVPPGA